MMKAEIISIGDELLIGQTINTNAAWMGEQLSLAGLSVGRVLTVADTKEEIIHALDSCAARTDIILMTGGLGPTKDDITKYTLCTYFNSKLVMHKNILNEIKAYFASLGQKMPDINHNQAMLPDNCTVLRNNMGTASGMWFEHNGKVFVSMPGVPYEMKHLMEERVIPKIKKKFQPGKIIHRTVQTQGIGESRIAEKVTGWENSLASDGIRLAYLPAPGQVRIRLSADAMPEKDMETIIHQRIEELKTFIPRHVFGMGNDVLEEVVGKLLLRQKKTIAVAESCTGGYLSSLFTRISGSSAYYHGGVVSYANHIKTALLKVPAETIRKKGPVSKEVVEAMALGVKACMHTDYGIATSGIAGPDGGTAEKPAGTIWLAIAGPTGIWSNVFSFGNARDRNIRKAAITLLNYLRITLEEAEQIKYNTVAGPK